MVSMLGSLQPFMNSRIFMPFPRIKSMTSWEVTSMGENEFLDFIRTVMHQYLSIGGGIYEIFQWYNSPSPSSVLKVVKNYSDTSVLQCAWYHAIMSEMGTKLMLHYHKLSSILDRNWCKVNESGRLVSIILGYGVFHLLNCCCLPAC